jgi:hypothetical protein
MTGSPATNRDIRGSESIGVGNEPTVDTTKYSLRLAIAFVSATAGKAGSACIARVNGNQSHARHLRLVRQERAQLRETPTMVQQSLSLPQPYPLAYSRQFFNGNTSLRVLGFAHHFFGDAMVDISGKPRFLAPTLLQQPPRAFGAFLLQLAPQAGIAHPHTAERFGAVNRAVAVNGDVCHAKVNTQKLLAWVLRRRG